METDLITYARDAAAKGDDLFLLLSTDATASESDIRRAFKRKALTAHPDKAGDAYDPALYERLERARDVLCSPAAREAYNSGMSAIRQKKLQLDQMSERRRKLVEDLERREQAAKRAKMGEGQVQAQRDPEREAMAARGRAKMEERQRLMREAEERESRAQRVKKDDERAKEHAEQTARNSTPKSPPTSPRPGASFADDGAEGLDAREAWLERRIKEKAERRAERARKKAVKSGVPLAPGSEAQNQGATPPPSSTGAAKTDADKIPPAAAPASTTSSSSANPAANPSARLSSTMARLKAAQAKRDEEKRKREAEALANSVEA
ncbi:hypothetical protein B0T25DRAFT_538411 [Lasiosphaeria hispida]|uniref:J domain-containing protein n=1 Tax=Lasiosphaeria hispida TaxID=260671 RepID=A0AAJ0HLM3_9PEZI|nr:hypothetical protein B0T25DRAFT_538411 [Lasiosphaeria hispida]